MATPIATTWRTILFLTAAMCFFFLSTVQAQTGLQFNGSNQYVTFGTAAPLGTATFTLECWFKRTGTGVTTSTGTGGLTAAIPLLTKGRGEAETPKNLNMNYFLGLNGNFLAADFEDTTSGLNHPVTGVTTITTNVWYHAALTFDGTTLRLYVNGLLDGSITPNAVPEYRSIQHSALATGLTSTGVAAGYFAGVLDEVRIWNYARSQSSIFDSMNVEVTTAVPGLLARWGLNDGSGTAATNIVAGSPNGTLTNSPTWIAGYQGFPVPPPAAPTALGVSAVSFGQMHLTWTDNATTETGFEIERSTTGSGGTYALIATTASNAISYEDLNLTALTEYYYRVRATGTGGPSAYASPAGTTTPAEGNAAVQLNGTSNYASLGQATTTLGVQSFTLECWFRSLGAGATTTSGTDGILAVPLITKGMAEADATAADMNFFLGINGTTFVSGRSYGPASVLSADFEEGTGASNPGLNHPVAGATPIASGVWYHAAVTYDAPSRRWQLFLNGLLEKDTVLATGSRFPQFNSTQHAAIGSALQSTGLPGTSGGYGPGYFNGMMDEVRIWNYARTQAEIQSTINAQIVTAQIGLLARWGMNEGTGSVVNSGAGTHVAGTLMGTGTTWPSPGAPFAISFTPPAAPTGLTAAASSATQILLQWTDNSSDETGFEVERSTTGSAGTFLLLTTTMANTLSFADQDLTPESEYCYRVRAINGVGGSAYTAIECATTPVLPNAGIQFGGTNAYVSFGAAPTLNLATFTLETWFKRDGAGVSNTTGSGGVSAVPLIAKGAAESENALVDINYFLGIHDTDNAICIDFEEGAGGAHPSLNHPLVGNTPIVTGVWYHASATYDGTTLKLYLNGSLESELAVGQPAASGGTTSLAALATSLRSNGTPQGYFNGTLDEVRIWNYARTQSDIRASINEQIASARSGLIGRWSLNEGSGTSVAGSAGTTVNGAITGANFTWTNGAPFNIAQNNPPDVPILISPAHLATHVPLSPTLRVQASDPDGGNLTVTFYGRQVTASPGADFTVVALPDAQFYTAQTTGSNATFKQQTQWVVSNRSTENIAFVSQLGDITNNGDDDVVQWRRADTSMSILETAVPTLPYGIAIGNHDQITGTTFYNQFFGTSRFAGRPYFGGNYGSNNNSNFDLFSAGGMDFIVVNIEMAASSPVLHWANGLLKTYSSRRAIIINHGLLATTGTPATFSASGQAIYDSLKTNANLFLMLCGHVDGEGQRQDTFNGHTVYTMLSDYQGRTNGGDGWMRLLRFSPANNEIQIRTYSPRLAQFEVDANSQFTVPYAMSSTSAFAEIGSMTVPSGATAAIAWPAVAPGTSYEWYAVVDDGDATTTSPTWQFETINASATVVTSSHNPAAPGDTVKFSASVTPASATGTVQFAVDGLPLGIPVTLTGGTAISDATATLGEGSHPVTAAYSGDDACLGSTSSVLTQIISSAVQNYPMTIAVVGNGTVALNPPGGLYEEGTIVTVTATPSSGWTFSGWSGSLTGSVNPTTVTMNGAKSITATFTDLTLAGYWKFDETTGTTAHDASSNALNGTVSGATWTTGKVNGGLRFNGTSNYVDIGNPSLLQSTGSMTWCAWVNAAGNLADDGTIIGKSAGADGWQLKSTHDSGPETFGILLSDAAGNYVQRLSQTVRALSTWYHVAAVYNATSRTLDIYVNGVLDNGVLSGTVPAAQHVPAVNVNIGRRSDGYYFNGVIDEARIYTRALSLSEIQQLVNPGPPQYSLATSVLGGGSITRNPDLASYDSAQVVTLTAVPASGWQFGGWSGDLTGTSNPAAVTMSGNKSIAATFIALPGAESISFVSYGDFGDGGTSAESVSDLIKSLNPGLIITNGDNNYSGNGTTSGWDNVVGRFYGQQYIHYPGGSTSAYAPGPAENAFFPSIGNHDMDLGVASQANYFDLPSNERYYTFVKGPVQFFALDSDTREPDGATAGSTQGQWLQAQLAASTAPWKVVYMHESPYSSCTTHGSVAHMQWPFEEWGADAVLSGHDHVYERILRDDNGDGKSIVYIVTGAGGHGLYNFGTPVTGSQFRYNASYGATFVEATNTSITFGLYSLASPAVPVDGYTMIKQTSAGIYREDFETFTTGQTVGSHAGWYDGSPSSGPAVSAGTGVPGSGGQASNGLEPSSTIATWTAHPFAWSDPTLEAVILGMDFRSNANGQFDDDRVCWNINQSTDSRYNFGVQLDNASGTYSISTYWRSSVANDTPRIQTPIVALTGIQSNTWYRLRTTITKISSNSASIGVVLYPLNSNGDSTGTPITGVVPNTSVWPGGAPDASYFSAGVMWPAFKNHTGTAGQADNAYVQYVIGTPVQYTLTTGTIGSGVVSLSPPGGVYNAGTVVTVTASPSLDWAFSGWSNDLTGSTNPATVTMNADKLVTATFVASPPGEGWIAFNDCVFDAANVGVATDPNGNLVHYRGANITTFGIGTNYTGPTTGQLIKRSDGSGTGVTATLSQSGGVTWQPDVSSSWGGGYDPNPGTDAYNTFHGIADMTGVIYYGSAAGWHVDLTITGLNPSRQYTFATSAARCNSTYTNRYTIYTMTGADTCVNASTDGVVVVQNNQVKFNTGDNRATGYVARWTNIRTSTGTITIRAEADPTSENGYRAYSFDVFMLQEAGSTPASDIAWNADISVSAGTSTQALTFGLAYGATDGIDAGLAELPLPPAPPTGVFDARFTLPVATSVSSLRDFRDSTQSHAEWTLLFQRALSGDPVTLAWDSVALQATGGRFRLTDAIGGVIVDLDMRAQSSLVLTNAGISSLVVVYDKIFCSEVAVDSGWNMISVPLNATAMSPAALFPGTSSQAYGYNNGYETATALQNGRGYWLEFQAPAGFTICGTAPTSTDIPVTADWNMIGPLRIDVATSAISTTPPGILNSPFYGFQDGYTIPGTLLHGKGYWISASSAGTIHLGSGVAAKTAAEYSAPDPTWPCFRFTDRNGHVRNLYLSPVDSASPGYQLPPVPPSGVLDVRFGSNTNIESALTGSYAVDLSSAAYPIRLEGANLAGMRFHVQDAINGSLLNADLSGNTQVVIAQRLSRIVIQQTGASTDVPKEFALSQNYPNPFNPTTTIRFALPVASRVNIGIFNVLGAKVTEIVDASFEAGTHKVVLDAAKYSSGIYFYKIVAGKFTSVRKMIVLK